jgi:hypothetical protein
MHLGLQPETLRVNLVTGADFLCTLRLNDNWPTGTTLKLVLPGTSWTATITGTDAVFSVDKATADTIADGTAVSLTYTNGTVDQTWALGTVVRRG